MKYLSVCSGIEAATVAWHHMGWEAVGYSEIEKFPSQVLAHHYPNVPNLGDMTKFKEWDIGTVDLLVGGTPCQSFSVAGLRKGLEDPRGNLALTYCAILDRFKPKWFVWENVPGVLSSGGGRDFGSFLGAVAQLGYGFAYRVLDAQYFGVAQRRKRVFVVGCLGNWRSAAEVLFERESLCGDIKKGKVKREDLAATIAARFGVSRNNYEELAPVMQNVYENHGTDSRIKPVDVCPTVTSRWGTGGNNVPLVNKFEPMTPTIAKCLTRGIGQRFDAETETMIPTYSIQGSGATSQTGNGTGYNENISFTLNSIDVHGVAQPIPLNTMTMQGRPSDNGRMGLGIGNPGDPCPTLTKGHSHAVAQVVHGTQDPCVSDIAFTQGRNNGGENVLFQSMAVRRLTPVECERLQGFPDNYTDIKFKGKDTPDGPRYKALGNSMAVPVMRWIGERINNSK